MNETVLQYWNRVKQYWNQFSRGQKITFLATVVLFILAAAIISYNLSKTEYALAYTDLQPSDAAAIKSYLDGAKIPYQLSADGKNIGVPRNKVAEVKIAVESQGLNKNGHLGYGAFKQSSFGMTDNEFKVKHLEAVQEELEQLINSNEAVSDSKVLINLPEQSVFLRTDQAEQASASVVLHVKPGYILDQPKVDTIFNLVSHSLPNLPVENITISDQNGDPLVYSKSAAGTLSTASMASQQFLINNQFRSDIQKNVTSMLGRILGPDKIVVSVFSTMNFDQKKSHEALVTPVNTVDQKGIEISLQELSKTYTGNGASPDGGVPGTGPTDVPQYLSGAASGKTDSEENQRTVNYEVNRITNDIVSTPYVVKDLTINVGIEPPVKDDPNSLTPETRQAVQQILVNIVRAALADNGQTYTDAQLSQKVTVFAHAFANPAAGAANKAVNPYLLYGGLGAAALGLMAGGLYLARRRRSRTLPAEADLPVPSKAEYPTIDLDQANSENQVRKQLELLAKRQPDEFVNLLRTWLADE